MVLQSVLLWDYCLLTFKKAKHRERCKPVLQTLLEYPLPVYQSCSQNTQNIRRADVICFNIKAVSWYDWSVGWVVYSDMLRKLFRNWWAMLWIWQHTLEEWYGPLEQIQAHWALHHGLVNLTISWAPQAVLCLLESCARSIAVTKAQTEKV